MTGGVGAAGSSSTELLGPSARAKISPEPPASAITGFGAGLDVGIVLEKPVGRGDLGVGITSTWFARIVLGHRNLSAYWLLSQVNTPHE